MNMHALVINLEHRTDRREHVIQELTKLHGVTYEFVNAIKHEDANIGCTLSHQRCIQIAKDRDLNHIMILEDDVILSNNFIQINKILYSDKSSGNEISSFIFVPTILIMF